MGVLNKMDMNFEGPNNDYKERLSTLLMILGSYGPRSDQARDYINRTIEELKGKEAVPGKFKDLALTLTALKWKYEVGTWQELMEKVRELGDSAQFTPPEVQGLEDYLTGLFGGDFKPEEE